ncbi:histone-like protein [Lachnoclostridium sp.]|uniref:histone-like protein n=1 Tax=Lachnoclostridium sp. TaxID=2028282 RepID=UPI003FA5C140
MTIIQNMVMEIFQIQIKTVQKIQQETQEIQQKAQEIAQQTTQEIVQQIAQETVLITTKMYHQTTYQEEMGLVENKEFREEVYSYDEIL